MALEPHDLPTAHRSITCRSVLLGLVAVVFVTGLTPYNDYVVASTFLVGSYLPVALVLWFFVLIVLVNAPLHRYSPRHALRPGELAVVMVMMLVACSIPSQGLMRSFIPMMIAPFYWGDVEPRFWERFLDLGLPAWLFPVDAIEEGPRSRIAIDFHARREEGAPIPFAAWATPLAVWGIFVAGLFSALIGLAVLLRHQWAVNERLPFPIAQLQMALIEPPKPGRMLNDLLGRWSFWIALLAVLLIQSMTAMHRYHPKIVPEIPLTYDLTQIMADEPLVYFAGGVKRATIFFTFIGITYFIQARIAFSLWAIFLIIQIINVSQRMVHREIHAGAWQDQYLGAAVAYIVGFLWIGRHYWATVLRQSVRGWREGEPRGEYLSHRTAVLLALAGMSIMIIWLLAMGVQPWMAGAILIFILIPHLVVARMVAETGMPFIRGYGVIPQLYTNLSPGLMSGRDVFFAGVFTSNAAFTTRESLLPFSMHALQVHRSTDPPRAQQRGVMGLIAISLVIGFVVAATSSLYCYYTYMTPITDKIQEPINPHLLTSMPRADVVNPMIQHAEGRWPPRRHDPWLHMGIGAGVGGFLQFAALRWTGWPFMIVGYLMAHTWYAHVAWFSIMIGWLCKVLIVKYGGASLYQRARPLFVGIIFGEAIAAGLWLLVSLALASAGYEYEAIMFLPH